jgi:hypothetical protein
VTCSTTAIGKSARSTGRDSANTAAISTPPAQASSNAPKVILSVNHQLPASEPKFAASVCSTRLGAGSV